MSATLFIPSVPFLIRNRPAPFLSPRRSVLLHRAPVCCTSPPSDPPDPPSLPIASSSTSSTSGNDIAFVGADRIGISFTCNADNCGTRISKSVRRRSYEKGTVLIQCPSCEKYHVIADNKGMYTHLTGGRKNVEEMAKQDGLAFKRVGAEVFGLEDVYWRSKNDPSSPDNSDPPTPPASNPPP